MNMKIAYKFSFIILFSLFVFASCQKDTVQVLNWSHPISGEWSLQAEYGDAVDAGPYHVNIYNTASGQDSIWIQDKDFWKYQVKAAVNLKTLTFNTDAAMAIDSSDVVTIKNGKIINTDSIYFEAEFKSDPGNIYKLSGHRRTGYDEYTK